MAPATTTSSQPSVWSSMSYTPPRGRCNYKPSLMTPACACLRFMLHPIKAATSFECDGCNHHASYHSMENPSEDAIVRQWAAEESERKQQLLLTGGQNGTGNGNAGRRKAVTAGTGGRKKRKALTQEEDDDDDVVEVEEID